MSVRMLLKVRAATERAWRFPWARRAHLMARPSAGASLLKDSRKPAVGWARDRPYCFARSLNVLQQPPNSRAALSL